MTIYGIQNERGETSAALDAWAGCCLRESPRQAAAALFLFFLILIIPASLLRVALPRLLIMRYGPLSLRPNRAREPSSRELILKLVPRSRRLRRGIRAEFSPVRCRFNYPYQFSHTDFECSRCVNLKRFSRDSRMRFREKRIGLASRRDRSCRHQRSGLTSRLLASSVDLRLFGRELPDRGPIGG